MAELVRISAYCGVVLSLGTFFLGDWLKKKLKWRFLNPLLLSILFTVGFLLVCGVDYDSYNEGAKYLSYLLTPATVCLAVPLYERFMARCRERGFDVQHGEFGADMQVASVNDGPVTILLEC